MKALTAVRRRNLLTAYLGIMLLPGPAVWFIFDYWTGGALLLADYRKAIAGTVAVLSIGMLGLLATMRIQLLAITHSVTFRRYLRRGYWSLLSACHVLTIALLIATCCLAIANIYYVQFGWLFHMQLISFSNNVVQVSLQVLATCNLVRRARHET